VQRATVDRALAEARAVEGHEQRPERGRTLLGICRHDEDRGRAVVEDALRDAPEQETVPPGLAVGGQRERVGAALVGELEDLGRGVALDDDLDVDSGADEPLADGLEIRLGVIVLCVHHRRVQRRPRAVVGAEGDRGRRPGDDARQEHGEVSTASKRGGPGEDRLRRRRAVEWDEQCVTHDGPRQRCQRPNQGGTQVR
jgi:hypothetical protein